MAPNILHLGCILNLTKPGLLTYYPEFIPELPESLKNWGKIEVHHNIDEGEAFGGNNLSLDENTIIVASHFTEVIEEYRRRKIDVIPVEFRQTIAYGAGPRCVTGVIRRD